MKRRCHFIIFILIFALCSTLLFQPNASIAASKRPKINVKKLTLSKNNTYTLRVYNMKKKQTVSFSSDNPNIVSVRAGKGNRAKTATVKAVNNGSTVVRATVYNKKGRIVRNLKTTVKVTPYGISIKFTKKKVKLNVGETEKLSCIVKPNTSLEMPVFESSDSSVATVNSRGIVTAISPGEVTITATLLSTGQKVQCDVIVQDEDIEPSEKPDDNRYTYRSYSYEIEETVQLS